MLGPRKNSPRYLVKVEVSLENIKSDLLPIMQTFVLPRCRGDQTETSYVSAGYSRRPHQAHQEGGHLKKLLTAVKEPF